MTPLTTLLAFTDWLDSHLPAPHNPDALLFTAAVTAPTPDQARLRGLVRGAVSGAGAPVASTASPDRGRRVLPLTELVREQEPKPLHPTVRSSLPASSP